MHNEAYKKREKKIIEFAGKSEQQSLRLLLIHSKNKTNVSIKESIQRYKARGFYPISLMHSDGSDFDPQVKNSDPSISYLEYSQDEKAKTRKTIGSLINWAMQRAEEDIVFVSWTDLDPYGTATLSMTNLLFSAPLCIVPVIEDENYKEIKFVSVLKSLFTFCFLGRSCKSNMILPAEYVGFYNRQLFLNINGYNESIEIPWLQLHEFAAKANMQNQEIKRNAYYRLRIVSNRRKTLCPQNPFLFLLYVFRLLLIFYSCKRNYIADTRHANINALQEN